MSRKKRIRKLRSELDAVAAAMTDDDLWEAICQRSDEFGERMTLDTCLTLASVSEEFARRKESGRCVRPVRGAGSGSRALG